MARVLWVLLAAVMPFSACAPFFAAGPHDAPATIATADSSATLDRLSAKAFESMLLTARWHLFRALDDRTIGRYQEAQQELDQAFELLASLEQEPHTEADTTAIDVTHVEVEKLGMAVEEAYLSLLPHVELFSPDSPLSLLLEGLSEEKIEDLPPNASPIVRILQLASLCDVPIDANATVAASIHFFQERGRSTFSTWLKRSGRYRDLVLPILREHGVPEDFFYLAMIESGFKPNAYSRAHAVGMWQFIQSTGKLEGLHRTSLVDERRDPVKSTVAAARHLRRLHEEFGDWRLAAAAYNAGRGRVSRAIERAETRNFWKLELPRETRNYVPLLMAATIIAKSPDLFGFGDVGFDPPFHHDEVALPEQVYLSAAAKTLGVPVSTVKSLNPELRGALTPRTKRPYRLRVPVGQGATFLARYERLPDSEKFVDSEYVVRRGDNISTIASMFNVRSAHIAAVNDLRDPNLIRPGQKLRIPGRRNGKLPANVGHYTVRRGDSLSKIALASGVSVARLKRWNGLRNNLIRAGDKLVTGAAAAAAKASRQTASTVTVQGSTRHTVRRGETLWEIAHRFDVEISQITAWNGLSGVVIHPGQELLVAAPDTLTYTVVKGDTLYAIARRFGLDAKQIARQNNMDMSSTLLAGMTLKIKNLESVD